MIKKYITIIIFTLLIIILMLACSINKVPVQNTNKDKPSSQYEKNPNRQDSSVIDTLAKLLPNQTNFTWTYTGFADYSHSMQLVNIDKTDNSYRYEVEGQVHDASGEEAKQDLSIELTYIIETGVLAQNIQSISVLDSNFPYIELIKTPLEKNNCWEQQVSDKNSNITTLNCCIQDVNIIDGKKQYTVLYNDTQSEYYEKRVIQEGTGVISFEKLLALEDGNYSIGYSLIKQPSQQSGINLFIPPVNNTIKYRGIEEYCHQGKFTELPSDNDDIRIFEFNGKLSDGSDREQNFKVEYLFDFSNQTVTENVISNSTSKSTLNSIINGLILIKGPIQQANSWQQKVEIDGRQYTVESEIIYCNDEKTSITVEYTVHNIEGYFDNTYIEQRTFEKGLGMTNFCCLIPGDIGVDTSASQQEIQEALANNMFGYSISIGDY